MDDVKKVHDNAETIYREEDIPSDFEDAVRYCLEAAGEGVPFAMIKLQQFLKITDSGQAAKLINLLEHAAADGSHYAIQLLSQMHFDGLLEMPVDREKAFQYILAWLKDDAKEANDI